MSGTAQNKTPATDAEWARDTQRRVEAVENPESTRVGAWVLSTSQSGALIASHVDGGSVTLATPPETIDDPDTIDSGLPMIRVSTTTAQNGQVAFHNVDLEIGDWGFSPGSNVVNVPTSGIYLVIAVPVYVTQSGLRRYSNTLLDGVRVISASNASNGEGASIIRPNMVMSSTFDLNAGQSIGLDVEGDGTGHQLGASSDNPGVFTNLSVVCLSRS